jgi:methionyl-tRNA synthetase
MPDTAATKPTIDYAAFTKLDLRVATVVSAEQHPNADKLLKIQLDDGSEGGRQVVIVANLEPRNLRGEPSEGMILCASKGDPRQPEDVVLLILDRSVPPGSAVT